MKNAHLCPACRDLSETASAAVLAEVAKVVAYRKERGVLQEGFCEACVVGKLAKPSSPTFRVEFTVERRGNAVRKAIEGKSVEKLLARVEKMDGYSVSVVSEAVSS